MTLDEATDRLYQSFSSHRRRETIDGCPHCVGKAKQDTLARAPLRKLSSEQLSRYAFKAMTTWGDPEDYKHFLPRILELAITREGRVWPGLDLQLIAGKLKLAEWRSWPQPEQIAVHDYFKALWKTVLARDPDDGPWRADDVLPGVAYAVEDVSPFLDVWETDKSLSSILQLADFIDSNWADVANRGHLQGLWREAPGRDRVDQWLQDPARKQSLEEAFERHLDEPPANRLAAAVDAWQWMTTGVR